MKLKIFNVSLIEDWKQSWKLFSVQVFAVLAFMPEIYEVLASAGLVDALPSPLAWVLRAIAVLGFIARVIKQKDELSK